MTKVRYYFTWKELARKFQYKTKYKKLKFLSQKFFDTETIFKKIFYNV